jgi:hypothetical protein
MAGVPGSLVGAFVVDQGAFVAPLALRLRVRLFHWELDQRLAAGADASASPELAARAAQLVSLRHRQRLADGLERIVRTADAAPHPTFSVVLGTARDQVVEARGSLLFLTHVLRNADRVAPRGAAIVDRLLTDGGSVLYVGGVRGAVALRVQSALDSLVGRQDASFEAWFSVRDSECGELVGHP